MNNFTLGGALILTSSRLLQTLWKHITSEDKFMILSRTTGAIIWNENQDKNVIVCTLCTKGSCRKLPLQPETRSAPKVRARFMEPFQAHGSDPVRSDCHQPGVQGLFQGTGRSFDIPMFWLPLWRFLFKIFNHACTKIHWELGPRWSRCSMLGPKTITCSLEYLGF